MEMKLNHCPFCGGEAKLMGGKVYTIPEIDRHGAYVGADIEVEPSWVECQSCHAMGQVFDENDEDPENAVATWNRRVVNSTGGTEVVRCSECKHLRPHKGIRCCIALAKVNGLGDKGFCSYGERRKDR